MLHQKRRGGDPMFLILSMAVLVSFIGVVQLGLREVREFRQSATSCFCSLYLIYFSSEMRL